MLANKEVNIVLKRSQPIPVRKPIRRVTEPPPRIGRIKQHTPKPYEIWRSEVSDKIQFVPHPFPTTPPALSSKCRLSLTDRHTETEYNFLIIHSQA